MEHIQDLEFRGHEIIILRDNLTQFYAVDIREDNADGEIIAGYADFTTEDDARYNAMAFIDGIEWGKSHASHDPAIRNKEFHNA